jgi:penicillin-binding protein 1A
MGLPPIIGPSSAPAAQAPQPSYPAQAPALAPTPTPDEADPDTPGASARYTPPVAQPQGQ